MIIDLLILLVCCLAISLLGLVIFLRNPHVSNNQRFAALSLSMVAWTAANYLSETSDSSVLLFTRVTFFTGALTIFVVIRFMAGFPDPKAMKNSVIMKAHNVFTGLILAASLTPYIVSSVQLDSSGGHIFTSFLYPAYQIYILYSLFCLIKIIRRQYKLASTVNHRQQVVSVSWGVALYALLAILSSVIIPLINNNWASSRYSPAFALIFVGVIAYTVIKHKLFDIRLVIARSLGYVLSLGVISILYGVLSYGLSSAAFSGIQDSKLETAINIGLLVFVAITFAPLKQMFDRVTNKYFYRDAYDPQQFIDQLNRVAITNVDVEPLLNRSTEIVNKHLKTTFCSVELRPTAYNKQRILGDAQDFSNEDILAMRDLTAPFKKRVLVTDDLQESDPKLYRILNKYDIGAIAKMTPSVDYGLEGIGLMLFGIKKSGNTFSEQDKRVIGIVSSELTIATQNALRFEEIENFSATLQDKVDDATRRLKRANDKLKTLDETKDEFISMASHQLRTPLTSVKGYVSMVLEGDAGPLNDMQKKLLEQSFVSSQRMVFLIADLLNLSRLKTGKFVIEAVPTNLEEVIEGEVRQLKETAAGKNLTLVYNQPKTFPILMLDETKIRQVIMNFVDNAIYYTPAGGKIEINLAENDKSVEFTVTDNGIGVPQAEQHHLFNKFYRAKNAQKARPDGTGLGLFMAKKVIVAQGGALIFSSAVGKGSTFGFSFAKEKLRVEEPPKEPSVVN